MKQYVISLALLIAALVALPTSHANAQSQPEMNRQAAKTSRRPIQNSTRLMKRFLESFRMLRARKS
jgi:hypothetical protein